MVIGFVNKTLGQASVVKHRVEVLGVGTVT
jgi:hypothetical protein